MPRTLRWRMVVLIALAVCPVAALVALSARDQERQAVEGAAKDVLRVVQITAAHEDRLIADARAFLSALAAHPDLRGLEPARAAPFLADLLRRNPSYLNLGVVAADGRLLASAVPADEGGDLGDRAYVRGALATGDFAVGDYQVGRLTRRSSLNFGQPLPGGAGVVFAALGLDWAPELIRQARLPEGATLLIVDPEGLVLRREPDPQRWTGRMLPDAPLVRAMLERREGSTSLQGLDGVERVYAFAALGQAGHPSAFLSVGFPAEAVREPARGFLYRSLLVLLLTGAVGMAVAGVLAEALILRRVRALAGAAERFSAGRLEEKVEVGGRDELAALGDTFNRMAQRLREQIEEREAARLGDTFNRMAQRLREQIEEREAARRGLEQRVADLVSARTRELTLLNELGDLLQACQSLEEASSMIGRAAGAIFPDDSGAVYVLASSQTAAERFVGWGPGEPGPLSFPPADCWALRRGQPHVVASEADPARCAHLVPPRFPALCRPLSAHGETLGVFHLAGGRDGLGDEKRRLAGTVAESIALALANLRLRENLRRQSVRDPLTDLFNRRHLEETLDRELARAARSRGALSVLMMDVDHFKRFNDSFGHAAGDLVLRRLGALLRERSRGADLPCRYGGEELCLVLPDTALDGAVHKAEQIRKEVSELQLQSQGQPLGALSISIGAAAFPAHGTTSEALLAAADAALYRAKKAGRDRVVAAE